MEFQEHSQKYNSIPTWVRFLIDFGFLWPNDEKRPRRIALLSMPCDSAAAALITLGSLIRDFGCNHTNDVDGHYDSLLRYAQQYLETCRGCETRCDPASIACGFTAEATGKIRSLQRPHSGYAVSDATDFDDRKIAFVRGTVTYKPDPEIATNYYIAGQPPPDLGSHDGALSQEAYEGIVESAAIIPDNLKKSYSGLALAGRAGGEAASKDACLSIRFCSANGEHSLLDLLTVHGWSPQNIVSRVRFFNARTAQFDRRASSPVLAVADGDTTFLKVLGSPDFQTSDVIGVFHRTIEHDNLEAIGNRMLGLRQWYEEDSEVGARLPAAPRGIGSLILRKRTT